jgi:TPR repeat protein
MKKLLLVAVLLLIAAGAGYWFYARSVSQALDQAPVSPAAPVKSQADIDSLKVKAEKGDSGAQAQLGDAFAKSDGVPLDYKQAVHWYELAATNGSLAAAASLGELYQAGQGVPKDLTNAIALFKRAAEGGDITGQFDLAYLYELGEGTPKSPELAAKWYGEASKRGDAMSQFLYGKRCLDGIGVTPDVIEGLKWLILASGQGQTDAATKLKEAEKDASSAQIDEARKRAREFSPLNPAK